MVNCYGQSFTVGYSLDTLSSFLLRASCTSTFVFIVEILTLSEVDKRTKLAGNTCSNLLEHQVKKLVEARMKNLGQVLCFGSTFSICMEKKSVMPFSNWWCRYLITWLYILMKDKTTDMIREI